MVGGESLARKKKRKRAGRDMPVLQLAYLRYRQKRKKNELFYRNGAVGWWGGKKKEKKREKEI